MLIIHKPDLLARILGYKLEDLRQICEVLKTPNRRYYYSYIDKKIKNGKVKKRPIDPSKNELRDIQNKIYHKILNTIPLPAHLHGSVCRKSNITNAQMHRSKNCHFQTDLTKFFQYVTCKMVFNMFRNYGYSPDVSHLLTQLTTYKGHLPQGAPTSPRIANLVGLTFDYPILEICKKNKITYTRFIDDLWLSSDNDFTELLPFILKTILDNGFLYSHAKTVKKNGKIEGTGCLLQKSGKMTITEKQRLKLADPNLKPKSRLGLESYKERVESK